MKNRIILTLVFITTIVLSCDKELDYTIPENMAGTTWKCTECSVFDDDLEYSAFTFTSETTVELWSKYIGENPSTEFTGLYTIVHNTITICDGTDYNNDDGDDIVVGVIDGTTINASIYGDSYIFTKE